MLQTAYVFIYLPGAVSPVVAGRFDRDTSIVPAIGYFIYAQSYLENPKAVPLDPIALPLKAERFHTTLSSGFLGVFRDAIPDDWGKQVAARLYGTSFQVDFDYLFLPSSDRMGALAFGATPQTPVDSNKAWPHEAWEKSFALMDVIQKIDRAMPLTAAEERVALDLGAGTSAGGVRPKMSVLQDNAIWLAKFNRHTDKYNVVRVEAAMLDLAKLCGIVVPRHRVEHIAGQDILLVERFDRSWVRGEVLRHRMVSAATLFQADEAAARFSYTGSYPRLSLELARWTVTAETDCRQLFRRMCFNALCSVTDDHERNHALVADGRHFRLAPAYDLVPQLSSTSRRLLALVIGDYGALATRANLLSSADKFLLTPREADEAIDEIQATVRKSWRELCHARGVSDRDLELIAGCFDPPDFETRS